MEGRWEEYTLAHTPRPSQWLRGGRTGTKVIHVCLCARGKVIADSICPSIVVTVIVIVINCR